MRGSSKKTHHLIGFLHTVAEAESVIILVGSMLAGVAGVMLGQ